MAGDDRVCMQNKGAKNTKTRTGGGGDEACTVTKGRTRRRKEEKKGRRRKRKRGGGYSFIQEPSWSNSDFRPNKEGDEVWRYIKKSCFEEIRNETSKGKAKK